MVNKQLIGFAGELLAQAELNLRGYSTSKAPDAEKSYDLIVNTRNGFKKIQVKASQYEPKKEGLIGWPTPDPANITEDVTYIFIIVRQTSVHDYYIVPGKEVKKSTHCGLTRDEMEVPVIIVER